MNNILIALGVSMLINMVMFLFAYYKQTDTLTDISYAASFGVVVTWLLYKSPRENGHYILWLLVIAWATRLGSFLLVRIKNMKVDHRFDKMRSRFWLFLRFWVLQALTVVIILVGPILFMNRLTNINQLSMIGLVITILGLIIESVADLQKFKFNSNLKNKGKWIASGIWKRTRHPNYLGEMMVWIGVYVFIFSSLVKNERLVALISPLYIVGLLLFVSGVPILERTADERWGKIKAYQEFKKKTGVILPKFRK